ncbi:hypothetical protein [Paraburkholderia sacchari]|uniref:hypothetical protein n=1 Tax=Paraburkholderia sacchari TaxID=159450 RepID=UPI001BD0B5B3|nr:hypothetical protein [Paraburkholderia sacchari]
MSFTIRLDQTGIYVKEGGAPLLPGQRVLLCDGLFDLPQHCEERAGTELVVREWRIPVMHGHYLLREFLPAEWKGWPW